MVWGLGIAGGMYFAYGPWHYDEGAVMLAGAALALLAFYAWGAERIRRMPSPSPGFARRLWALMLFFFLWLGIGVPLVLFLFLLPLYHSQMPDRQWLGQVVTLFLSGCLILLGWMAVSLSKWRTALYDVGKGRRDEIGIS